MDIRYRYYTAASRFIEYNLKKENTNRKVHNRTSKSIPSFGSINEASDGNHTFVKLYSTQHAECLKWLTQQLTQFNSAINQS